MHLNTYLIIDKNVEEKIVTDIESINTVFNGT